MKKLAFIFLISLMATACNWADKNSSRIIGEWKVESYQYEILIDIDEEELALYDETAERTERKLREFALYTFNKDGTYHLVFSPMNEDQGIWSLQGDSLLILNSTQHHEIDTARIAFESKNLATITMSNPEQAAYIQIQKKK